MRARWLLLTLAVSALSSSAQGIGLYATYRGPAGPSGDSLWQVNPETGATQLVAALPNRIWGDISARPGETESIYGVARLPGSEFQNQVSTIDVQSGVVSDLFTFHASDFGYAAPYVLELEGMAIAASHPSIAVIGALVFDFETGSDSTYFLFDLDLDTGATSNVQTLSGGPDELTYSSGESLFTVIIDPAYFYAEQLATIDRSNGSVNGFGAHYNDRGMRAIEFDPIAGELFGVDDFGELVVLSASTGAVLDERGQTGLGNQGQPASVSGLAFIVPEPGTGFLLLIGLVGYGLGSNGRGGSRQSSRRA